MERTEERKGKSMGRYRILLFLLGLLLCLAGCGEQRQITESVHVHKVPGGQVVRPLSCTTDERTLGRCGCGALVEVVSRRAPGSHSFEDGSCTACGGLLGTELEFSLSQDGNSYTVVGMGACQAAHLIIPDSYEGKPVTAIGPAAFFGQKSLTVVEVPEGIQTIGQGAFSDTLALRTVLLPESLRSIDTLAFSECWSLKLLYLPSGVQTLGENALLSHGVLEAVHVSPENPWLCSVNGVLFDKAMTTLLTYPSGRANARYTVPEGVRSIGDHAFQRSENLQQVILPDTVEAIGASSFFMCQNLRYMQVPGSVKTIGDAAFSYCQALERVDLTEGLVSLGDGAFSGCKKLETAWVPDSVTELGSHAFSNCMSLKRLTIGRGVTVLPESLCAMSTALEALTVECVTQVEENALLDCYGLLELRFSGTLEQWDQAEKAPGWDAGVGKYMLQCADGTVTCTPQPEETEE